MTNTIPLACIECVLSGVFLGVMGALIVVRKGVWRQIKAVWLNRCLTSARLQLAAARDRAVDIGVENASSATFWSRHEAATTDIGALEEEVEYLSAKLAALNDPAAVW